MTARLLAVLLAVGPAPAAAETITVTVSGLRSDEGVVRACMTQVEAIFPRCIRDPQSHRAVTSAKGTVVIRFDDVGPGEYAIALLHDENDNGKADRTLGMMPREGYGFSRDARVRMGPPDWRDAVFTHDNASQDITIRMRYFL